MSFLSQAQARWFFLDAQPRSHAHAHAPTLFPQRHASPALTKWEVSRPRAHTDPDADRCPMETALRSNPPHTQTL